MQPPPDDAGTRGTRTPIARASKEGHVGTRTDPALLHAWNAWSGWGQPSSQWTNQLTNEWRVTGKTRLHWDVGAKAQDSRSHESSGKEFRTMKLSGSRLLETGAEGSAHISLMLHVHVARGVMRGEGDR